MSCRGYTVLLGIARELFTDVARAIEEQRLEAIDTSAAVAVNMSRASYFAGADEGEYEVLEEKATFSSVRLCRRTLPCRVTAALLCCCFSCDRCEE